MVGDGRENGEESLEEAENIVLVGLVALGEGLGLRDARSPWEPNDDLLWVLSL